MRGLRFASLLFFAVFLGCSPAQPAGARIESTRLIHDDVPPVQKRLETIGGCTWNDGCTGTPDACSTHTMAPACDNNGCTWTECSGTSAACSGLTVMQCGMQPGCSVM
jgi:hypothetical protein